MLKYLSIQEGGGTEIDSFQAINGTHSYRPRCDLRQPKQSTTISHRNGGNEDIRSWSAVGFRGRLTVPVNY